MFDESGDPVPLDARLAVARGVKCVRPIAGFFAFLVFLPAAPALLAHDAPHWVAAGVGLLLWHFVWAFVFRRWKAWALAGGCPRPELEDEAVDLGFAPARGSVLWYLGWLAYRD